MCTTRVFPDHLCLRAAQQLRFHSISITRSRHSVFPHSSSQTKSHTQKISPLLPRKVKKKMHNLNRGSGATLAVLSLAVCTSNAAKKCYFPDGRSSDANYVPCFPNNEESFCCHTNDYCTQGGFCLSVLNGYHYRGACTDTSWRSKSCPATCLDNLSCLFPFHIMAKVRMVLTGRSVQPCCSGE
jgi:hypothetical protein